MGQSTEQLFKEMRHIRSQALHFYRLYVFSFETSAPRLCWRLCYSFKSSTMVGMLTYKEVYPTLVKPIDLLEVEFLTYCDPFLVLDQPYAKGRTTAEPRAKTGRTCSSEVQKPNTSAGAEDWKRPKSSYFQYLSILSAEIPVKTCHSIPQAFGKRLLFAVHCFW